MCKLISKLSAQAIFASIVIAFSTSVFAAYVDLIVTGSDAGTKLEIGGSNVKCGSNKNCIQTTKGSSLDLDFKLDKACQAGGPNYKLSGTLCTSHKT